MTNAQKIITAAATGAAAGILAGILLAPEKGSVTRQKIASGGRKIADGLRDFTESGTSAVTGMRDKLFKKKDSNSKMVENNIG